MCTHLSGQHFLFIFLFRPVVETGLKLQQSKCVKISYSKNMKCFLAVGWWWICFYKELYFSGNACCSSIFSCCIGKSCIGLSWTGVCLFWFFLDVWDYKTNVCYANFSKPHKWFPHLCTKKFQQVQLVRDDKLYLLKYPFLQEP